MSFHRKHDECEEQAVQPLSIHRQDPFTSTRTFHHEPCERYLRRTSRSRPVRISGLYQNAKFQRILQFSNMEHSFSCFSLLCIWKFVFIAKVNCQFWMLFLRLVFQWPDMVSKCSSDDKPSCHEEVMSQNRSSKWW